MEEKYLDLFFDEVQEHIDDLNRSLLELEQDYTNPEIINEIFRIAHTLKSSAGFVGLEYLSRLAHKMEDLFQLIKDKKILVKTELMNLLFSCLDAIKNSVASFQANREEEKEVLNELAKKLEEYSIKEVQSFNSSDITKAKSEIHDVKKTSSEILKEKEKEFEEARLSEQKELIQQDDKIKMKIELTEEDLHQLTNIVRYDEKVFHGYVQLEEEAPMKNLRLLLIYNRLFKALQIYKIDPSLNELERNSNLKRLEFVVYGPFNQQQIIKLCQIDLIEKISVKEIELQRGLRDIMPSKTINQRLSQEISSSKEGGISKDKELDTESVIKSKSIRVPAEKIDYILNNVGELVITNSGLQKIYDDLVNEFGETQTLTELRNKIEQAIRIARELQSGVMKMRMMPVGVVFQRFHRPVRDLAMGLGKKVELIIQGEDTELDKNIIDSLNDPLMHLIRNAIDHGIEPSEERIQKGKPETGTIILKAYQSGNHIFIEVQDDGRGLNKEKILEKAKSLGLLNEKEQLTENEIYQFIFQPGFSTAERVSNISGRGVGMNVVKDVVDQFKGSIQINTTPGVGTSFILMFPLTLAIISTIHVKVEDEEYAFPLSDVVETVRISPSQITTLQGKNIINLRKEIVPVYELSVLMGLPSKWNGNVYKNIPAEVDESAAENQNKEIPVVIVSIGSRKVGYIVDEMIGKREIVIKSLEQNYKNILGLIGACLLGDGSIVMVLDVNGLLEIATQNYDAQIQKIKQDEEIINAIKVYNQKVKELSTTSRRIKKKSKSLPIKEIKEKEEFIQEPQEPKKETAVVHIIEKTTDKNNDVLLSSANQNEAIQITQKEIQQEDKTLDKIVVIEEFRKEKERRKEIGLEIFKEGDSIVKDEKQFLSEKDYEKLYSVVNSGMINAGLVLTQLLGVTIDVSVPEFKAIEFHDMEELIQPDKNFYSIFLETGGEFESLLCLVFDEDRAIVTAGELMGIPMEQRKVENIDIEDIKSVLNELTNIVGSSLLNEIANRTNMTIKPSVPELHLFDRKKLMEYIYQKKQTKQNETIIYIGADFLREETELL
ncbi:MAG: chemotaxis protein CheW, partial [Leptospiraceae bacterium]|nr:chemotaxis protein CheW [Leptospiraceae bacterium]